MKITNMPNRRDEKRAKAEVYEAARAARTPQQQLDLLDSRGMTAKRERERLSRQISVSGGLRNQTWFKSAPNAK